ncbi:hypothetical protein BJ165DRAFT_1355933 [Panaeolus papilionaceus]|nr:hypothetical protein BJ165DRAFT_1355933 [Panaeolus papilionaceus]
MAAFLQGRAQYSPIDVIDCWMMGPDSRLSKAGKDASSMYSFDVPYHQIKAIRPALTSFAAQTIEHKVDSEARRAVRPDAGLHASLRGTSNHKLTSIDVGASTFKKIGELQMETQPVTCKLLESVAGGAQDGKTKRRPVELVRINALSSLDFARNPEARLLPLMRGLFYFAHSAPTDLIAFGSRVGEMPSYSTIYNAAKQLGDYQATSVFKRGRDATVVGALQLDNVQNYLKPQDQRIGRIAQMNIGIAGTFYELKDVNITALDLNDRRERLTKNERANLNVHALMSWIDQPHLDIIFTLHWLRALVTYIPELEYCKTHVHTLFRTRGAKVRLNPAATPVHSLSTSGKNETYTTELKDGLVDFLAQIGQVDGDYHNRLILVGGDGLTFQKILEMKKYLQFHKDPLQSMEVVEPVLALWHLGWTDLSRIYETHYDSSTSPDPASLGHSASQIGRKPLTNLKKVDFHPESELLEGVLLSRMLDCWRILLGCTDLLQHFKDLAAAKKLPHFEDLESHARVLHRTYSSSRAIYHALGDTTVNTTWAKNIPLSSKGPFPTPSATSSTTSSTAPAASLRHKNGDQSLANSIAFMRDAIFSREFHFAVAEGDVGRVYEVIKVMLFTFAGSTHTKYTTYLLEFLTRLELESSSELKEAILRSTLVNLCGREGSFCASDLMQEYFNRLLEAVVDKKGSKYDDDFIRSIISPNLHHFARLKLEMRNSVGLAPRSGRHSAPHLNAEITQLLKVYKDHDLHLRRPGRVYNEQVKDDFANGLSKLQDGRLDRWVSESAGMRDLLRKSEAMTRDMAAPVVLEDSDDESDNAGELNTEPYPFQHVLSGTEELMFTEVVDAGGLLSTGVMPIDLDDLDGIEAFIHK